MKKEIAGVAINSSVVLRKYFDAECVSSDHRLTTVTNVSFVNCTFTSIFGHYFSFVNCEFTNCNFDYIIINNIEDCFLSEVIFNCCRVNHVFEGNKILTDICFNHCQIDCCFKSNTFVGNLYLIFKHCCITSNFSEQFLKRFHFIDCNIDYSIFSLSCMFQFKADKAICKQIVAHAVRILELSDEGKDIIDGMKHYIVGWKHEKDF